MLPALLVVILFSHALSVSAQTPTPVPVTTWRYDLTHAGQNTQETALTPANVNPSTFGKLFTLPVDSTIYPQPLYVPNLKMNDGQFHNVLFVATSNDSLYAFDADSNGGANASPLWHVSLLSADHGAGAGATAVPYADTGSPDVAPTVGITGTPAIDTATNTMYVVANTKENGNYFSRLHAINIITGAEQSGSPVEITATVPGTGHGSSGGQVAFSPLHQNQRTALQIYNGYVYFGYAAHGDFGDWHGWLFSYNEKTLQQTDVLCLSPNGYGAGIWSSGAGLPIDNDAAGGRMFIVTGNGTHSTFPPFDANTEYGESVVTFNLTNGKFTPTDGFTSFNFQTLNNGDYDQGSGGLLMIPDNTGPNPHMLITAGKEGRILVLNRDNLGGFMSGATANNNALQDITGVVPSGLGFWSTAAYWNNHVYMWAEKNYPMMFNLVNGVLDTAPDSKGAVYSDFPDPTFSVSANGDQDGIAWAVLSDKFNSKGPAVLYAWDATDLTSPIYESDTNAGRDTAGPANKFAIPVVTNGKVYFAAQGEVDVYGLLNSQMTAEDPVISPNGGSFDSTQSVQITSGTSTANIYYTLDGSTPTPASALYSGPITVASDTTVKAMASAPGYIQSGVTTAVFNFTNQTPPLTVTPPGGTYLNAQTVTLADSDANAKIYYTTDGSTPSAASKLYAGPLSVSFSQTIKAIAIDPTLANSPITTAAYVIQNGGTKIDFSQGFSSTDGLTLNGSAKASNDTRLQLTDGGLEEAGSVFWNAPINIQAFSTTFEFQVSAAQANGFTFTIQNNKPTELGGDSAGLGYQDIPKSIAVKFNFYDYNGSGSDATGLYTNGQPPLTPIVDLTGSNIILNGGDAIQAQISYDGTNLTLNLYDLTNQATFTHSWPINIPATVGGNTAYVGFTGGTGGLSASQKILTWTYETQALPPVFSPAAGTYSTPQQVSLATGTADAAIYYTTDGSTPTAASTQYTEAVPVAATETINAVAISPTVGTSEIVKAPYIITSTQSEGTIALAATQPAPVPAGTPASSTVTVTPTGGFTGAVTIGCTVTGPSGAASLPTCAVTQPPSITSASTVSASLTIGTQATTTPGNYTANVTGTSGDVTASTTVSFTVTPPPAAPSFSLSSQPATIPIQTPGGKGSSVITVTPTGGFTGQVTLACSIKAPANAVDLPACSVVSPPDIDGTQAVTGTINITTQATTTPGTYTATVTGTSGTTVETTTVAITVGGATTGASFTLGGQAITVSNPGTNATSTITVTPAGGFLGTIALSCAVTSSPSAAVNVPTCSITQPPAITGTQAVTATLTVSTTSTTALLHDYLNLHTLGLGGGGTLAVLFFCVPFRRRKLQAFLSMLILLVVVGAASGCGSSKPGSGGGGTGGTGTTPGSYTVTVTGTSGSQQATTAVTVTVQ